MCVVEQDDRTIVSAGWLHRKHSPLPLHYVTYVQLRQLSCEGCLPVRSFLVHCYTAFELRLPHTIGCTLKSGVCAMIIANKIWDWCVIIILKTSAHGELYAGTVIHHCEVRLCGMRRYWSLVIRTKLIVLNLLNCNRLLSKEQRAVCRLKLLDSPDTKNFLRVT